MVSVAACKICGASLMQYTLDEGGFCNSCGMKFLAGGIPAFSPDELHHASETGDDGFLELASRVGMPVANVMQIVSLFKSKSSAATALDHSQTPLSHGEMSSHPMAGSETERSLDMGFSSDSDLDFFAEAIPPTDLFSDTTSASDTKPPGGLMSGIGAAPTPSLKFSYDDAFYHNQSGEVTLLLAIESSALTLQDVKLTVDGDIARTFNVNMEDFLGAEKKIVVTPTVFPTSSLKITVSSFDQYEQPHCWKGDTIIRDVEQTLDIEGTQHIHLSSSGNVGDSDINIKVMDASQTLRRRKLAQPFRCEVILTCDDVAERRLVNSSRADRIKARETFAMAKHRVEKGRFEKAYKLIREVEEIGFMLRDAQSLRVKIEHKLSFISLEKAKDLFGEGRLREAYEFLQERKGLVYNPGMTELLIEIEDIGEDCKEAGEFLIAGNLARALMRIESIEKTAPKYEQGKLLRASYVEAVENFEAEARQKEADNLLSEEIKANELKLASEREECQKRLSEIESTIDAFTLKSQWRKVFDTLALYRSIDGHSLDVIKDAAAEYNKIAGLRPLGRLAGPDDNDPDILLIADPELTIGRDPRNTIVLIDASCKTGRSQGRIVRSDAGVWQIQRCKGEFGSSVQPIEVNDAPLEPGESKELSIHDVLSFSGIVKMEITGPESEEASRSLELSYLELLPEDEDYLELARWILIDSSMEAGSSDESNLMLPRIDGQAFTIHLLHDLFWIEPVKNSSLKITVNDEPLTSLRPLFHNELICINGEDYYFYQVCSEKELWLGEDELDERKLPA